ncbi:MAG: RNA polymerase sigma factor [candidate division WOR-3 bacterium]|nr:MAG: RNA polymerase sigma factor [candidate division WOR-3 bacterium]
MGTNPSLLVRRDIGHAELADIVRRAKEGEDRASSDLCVYVYAHIYSYLYYRVDRAEDAEDLTSEIVVKVIQSIAKQRGNFHAWIYQIARNHLIDFYRRRAVRSEISLNDIPEQASGKSDGFSKQVLTREKLKRGLKHLTEEQRQVVILKFIEGHDNREIASIIHKSVGAVKVLQFRALKALRDYFTRREVYEAEN